MTMIEPGDWIGTVGKGRFPKSVLYGAINRYSKHKYPVTKWRSNPVWDVTHVRIPLGSGLLFEVTVPRARIIEIDEAQLGEKHAAGLVRVVRFKNARIDQNLLRTVAREMDGKPYDIGDLVDFGLSGILGLSNFVLRIFGDKLGRMKVCSTGAALMLSRCGVTFPVDTNTIDPCAPYNHFGKNPAEAVGRIWEPFDITNELTSESFKW